MEKIIFYIPQKADDIINSDARMFEILKSDKQHINKNRFLTLLLLGYQEAFEEETGTVKHKILDILEKSIKNEKLRHETAEELLNTVFYPVPKQTKGKRLVKISYKPVKETESIINSLIDHLGNNSLSSSLCRIITSYTSKPLNERERIIFNETCETVEKAIANNQQITFNHTQDLHSHTFIPFGIAAGTEEMFNYVLGAEENEQSGQYKAITFRLCRISFPKRSTTFSRIPPNIQKDLTRMEKQAPQFAINDDEEICVEMNEQGVELYKKIYYCRPNYTRIEKEGDHYLYYFGCSLFQASTYFRRFSDGSALVRYPESLQKELSDFHSKNAEAYRRILNHC